MKPIYSGSMAGKTVVVTGATGGIGRATALGMAAMGARLAITGRDRERAKGAAREMLGIGFRLGEMMWGVWLGIVMFRGSESAAARKLRAFFVKRGVLCFPLAAVQNDQEGLVLRRFSIPWRSA